GSRLVFDVVLTLVFGAAFLIVFRLQPLRWVALALAVPTVVGAWVGYAVPGLPRAPVDIVFHLSAVLLFTVTTGTILRTIYREAEVTANSVYGAFCGYVLIGVTFGHLYCVIESAAPGSFRGGPDLAGQLRDEDRRHAVLTYFSLITLTTVGYGDVTPAR